MEFLIKIDIFQYFPSKWKFTDKTDFKTKSTNQLHFLANKVTYFWNKFPNFIKNRNCLKNKAVLDDLRKKNGKKKVFKREFWGIIR